MRSFTALIVAGLVSVVNAHFQLQYPPPRGAFVEDQETGFCDGYTSVAANRTEFPLNNGILSLNSEHPKWTATVLLSNASDPTSFDNFSQIIPFFSATIEGSFCMTLDLTQTNATGIQDGSNVTLQVLYAADDGNLYQCADLTLSNTASVSGVSCSNSTSSALSLPVPPVSSLLGLAGLAYAFF